MTISIKDEDSISTLYRGFTQSSNPMTLMSLLQIQPLSDAMFPPSLGTARYGGNDRVVVDVEVDDRFHFCAQTAADDRDRRLMFLSNTIDAALRIVEEIDVVDNESMFPRHLTLSETSVDYSEVDSVCSGIDLDVITSSIEESRRHSTGVADETTTSRRINGQPRDHGRSVYWSAEPIRKRRREQ